MCAHKKPLQRSVKTMRCLKLLPPPPFNAILLFLFFICDFQLEQIRCKRNIFLVFFCFDNFNCGEHQANTDDVKNKQNTQKSFSRSMSFCSVAFTRRYYFSFAITFSSRLPVILSFLHSCCATNDECVAYVVRAKMLWQSFRNRR